MNMIDLETLKKEVYQKEKKKMIRRFLSINLLLVFVVTVSLSSVKVTEREKELINTNRRVMIERDSLKNIITNELALIKKTDNKLIRGSLSLSMDTTYIDTTLSAKNIYEIAQNQLNTYKSIENVINSKWDSISRIPNGNPVTLADMDDYTDGFGYRKHPVYHKLLFHEGIDISADLGSDVFVTADGIVEKVIESNMGYGNRIVVNHGNGYKTVYAHLSKIHVSQGQKVKKFELIGNVGDSGTTTGYHLHYEVLIRNRPVDPYTFLDTHMVYAKK